MTAHETASDLIQRASDRLTPGLEHIRYNAHRGFTLQPMFLTAPIRTSDDDRLVREKLRLGAIYLDLLLGWKEWNGSPTDAASMQALIANAMERIRDTADPETLATGLHSLIEEESGRIPEDNAPSLERDNEAVIHRILARFTEYVEHGSGGQLDYDTLVSTTIENPFRIAHIGPDSWSPGLDEYASQREFDDYHDRLGNLLLLTSTFIQSHGDAPFDRRVKLYMMENLLAASLQHNAYLRRPGLVAFIDRTGLPFQMHEQFGTADVMKRQRLYTEIARRIWNPRRLLDAVAG